MDIKNEYKAFLYILGGFLLVYFLPVDWAEFQESVIASLQLARWYAREHVVLCLLPAFLIAGAIAAFMKQDMVVKYLGPAANKYVAYPFASISGSMMAVCSCTVLPLFAGIFKTGAGIGPAVVFLYSGPAINILAIVLTAQVLGIKLGIARAVGAIVFSVIIGLLMHLMFAETKQEQEPSSATTSSSDESRPIWQQVIFYGLMIFILVFATWAQPGEEAATFWHLIFGYRWYLTVFFSASLGLVLVEWFDLAWWKLSGVGLVALVAYYVAPETPELSFGLGVLALSFAALTGGEEMEEWIGESWEFTKLIMPLLLAGVIVAGIFFGMPGQDDGLIPAQWVAQLVGENTLTANFLASISGALMYFATLTEIPILEGLMGNGMAEGPALSLLLAGPAVSLPNLLVIHSVLGTRKTLAFFIIVVVMSSLGGYTYGMIL